MVRKIPDKGRPATQSQGSGSQQPWYSMTVTNQFHTRWAHSASRWGIPQGQQTAGTNLGHLALALQPEIQQVPQMRIPGFEPKAGWVP